VIRADHATPDRLRRVCGNHRQPGITTVRAGSRSLISEARHGHPARREFRLGMHLMIALCAGCHAKVHRTKVVLTALPTKRMLNAKRAVDTVLRRRLPFSSGPRDRRAGRSAAGSSERPPRRATRRHDCLAELTPRAARHPTPVRTIHRQSTHASVILANCALYARE
jgi:hypothetical protein